MGMLLSEEGSGGQKRAGGQRIQKRAGGQEGRESKGGQEGRRANKVPISASCMHNKVSKSTPKFVDFKICSG